MQQSIADAGFLGKPVKIMILDKGQRSVKGLNSGTEKVTTLDLIVVLKKDSSITCKEPLLAEENDEVIGQTMANIELSSAFTASHVYLEVLRTAMSKNVCISNINLHDIVVEIEKRGFTIDPKTGYLEPEIAK